VLVGDTKMNIVDTPGHADFGGEVERGLSMVDGVLLLVDASEGPLPQTRFVLRKALERDLPIILVINKIDRHDARVAEVVDEAYGLFIDLDANDRQLEFPIVYTNARAGTATLDIDVPGTDLTPLFDTIKKTVPGPKINQEATLQVQVTNLDASEYVGRLALCRIYAGELRKGQTVAWCVPDRTGNGGAPVIKNVRIAELYVAEAMGRVPAESASAGDICSIAGVPEIMIGDTLADLEDPRVLAPDTGRRAGHWHGHRHQLFPPRRPRRWHQADRPSGR